MLALDFAIEKPGVLIDLGGLFRREELFQPVFWVSNKAQNLGSETTSELHSAQKMVKEISMACIQNLTTSKCLVAHGETEIETHHPSRVLKVDSQSCLWKVWLPAPLRALSNSTDPVEEMKPSRIWCTGDRASGARWGTVSCGVLLHVVWMMF